jgi:hypothetical protein
MPHIIKLLLTPSHKAGYDAISVWAKDSAVTILSSLWKYMLLTRDSDVHTFMSNLLGSIEESRQSGYVDRLLHIYQRKKYNSKT